MTDVYQERYLAHLARKRRGLAGEAVDEEGLDRSTFGGLLRARRSQRQFDGRPLAPDEMGCVYEAIRLAPSSCNRQAICVRPIVDRKRKVKLEQMLVGGRVWLSDAAMVLLFFADPLAYKSPAEGGYMPYLDAGFAAAQACLAAEAACLGACFVNPNVRPADRAAFAEQFNRRGLIFCGALALGHYARRTEPAPKRELPELFY